MATGWFQKATGVFGRREAPPQPFELTCDCGAKLTGFRANAPQKPACPACGTIHFVLPACVLPIPDSVRDAWYGVETPAKKSPKSAEPKLAPAPLPAKGRKRERAAESPAAPVVPLPTASERLRAFFTPVRIVLLSVVVVIVITTLVLVRASRREWARSHLQPAIERGLEALRGRDFPTASAAFAEANLALDRLRRNDDGALAVRQYQREADIAAQLSLVSVPELLQQVAEIKNGADITERFRDQAAGKWLVFDSMVEPLRSEDRVERCLVDVPLAFAEQPIDVAFDAVPFPSLWTGNNGPRRVVFAAQWDRIELPKGKDRHMTLVLRSATAVLWCHWESYRAISLAMIEGDQEVELRNVLQSQKQALGVGDAP